MRDRHAGVIGGLHEVTITVTDLEAALAHWRCWGYRPGISGRLDARDAEALYGVPHALQAMRLEHGRACSGLVRLQRWHAAAGDHAPGLALAPMRTLGSRWSVHRTRDVTPALAWARTLVTSTPPARVTGPVVHAHGGGAASINLAVFTPLYRHVVLVRHGVEVPAYGTPDPGCLLGTSEVCHAGLVLPPRAREALAFYERLGLRRASERVVAFDPESVATQMFPLAAGERLTEIDFDDARAGPGPAQLPGRLRVFLLESPPGACAGAAAADDAASFTLSAGDAPHRPVLGYGAYTLRFAGTRTALERLGARVLGEGRNEFGEHALRFLAPDGSEWLAGLSDASQ